MVAVCIITEAIPESGQCQLSVLAVGSGWEEEVRKCDQKPGLEGQAFRKEEQKETQQEWDVLSALLVLQALPVHQLTSSSHLL